MCGRYNLIDSPGVRALCELLGVALHPQTRLDIRPGSPGDFVLERDGRRELVAGLWSLLIEPKPDGTGFRPHPKFASFNARADRLQSSPLWRRRYTTQRAIVPATGWHEWLGKTCYWLRPERAIAFGALYEFWRFGERVVPAYTIITLPPHPKIAPFHDKSLPLMLGPEDFDAWLDPGFRHVDDFADLLAPRLKQDLYITPVASAASLSETGETLCIAAD